MTAINHWKRNTVTALVASVLGALTLAGCGGDSGSSSSSGGNSGGPGTYTASDSYGSTCTFSVPRGFETIQVACDALDSDKGVGLSATWITDSKGQEFRYDVFFDATETPNCGPHAKCNATLYRIDDVAVPSDQYDPANFQMPHDLAYLYTVFNSGSFETVQATKTH